MYDFMYLSSSKRTASLTALFLLLLTAPVTAQEKEKTLRWKEGLWRLETSTFTGTRSGRRSRSGDVSLNATVEYELTAGNRSATGIRLHPLFLYEENKTDKTIWGVAVGPTIRIYQNAEFRRGLFGEIAGSVLWHSNEFRGNTSRINFLTETRAIAVA